MPLFSRLYLTKYKDLLPEIILFTGYRSLFTADSISGKSSVNNRTKLSGSLDAPVGTAIEIGELIFTELPHAASPGAGVKGKTATQLKADLKDRSAIAANSGGQTGCDRTTLLTSSQRAAISERVPVTSDQRPVNADN